MSNTPQRSSSLRFSRQGFRPLSTEYHNSDKMGTTDIPLQTVVSHTPSQAGTFREKDAEKSGMFRRHGRRKVQKLDPQTLEQSARSKRPDEDDDKTALNKMGKLYMKVLNFSIVTRYMIYVAPLAIILAIPIILSQTVLRNHKIAGTDGRKFWIWIEIVWLSLWGCKIVAHFLPRIFEFLMGVVSPGVRKYALLISSVEKTLALVFWMIVNQVTFAVLVNSARGWDETMRAILRAGLISSVIILAERVLIQLISISYHRKQFDQKIKESKRNIFLLGLLYDASRELFPSYCNEFAEEDYLIQDSLQLSLGSKKDTMKQHNRSGSTTPMRLLQNVGRVGDKVTSAFGTVAQEITGKKVFDPNSAHSIVLEALDKNRSAEALARRIWMSFVVEGKDSLFQEDLIEVMGPGRQEDAEECFGALDRDGNGDISLDEMIMTVTEYGRERKSIATSMHDVDQAINALDGLLFTIVLIVCLFVFIAFLSPSFVTTLTTSATALLSLSFVFAATCQEVLGSCIFLFVKHPYDIGDRVDITAEQLTVEHISLLYTVFKRVSNGKVVQIPNIVLNNLWVENITRSKAMREQLSIFVSFDTTFEDVNLLKQEMQNFVRDPQNSRDFHPEVDLEVMSIAEMNKLELKCEIRHKSNWSNDALRSSRRSKFMCALVLALRKIPIYGPGGGDAPLGDAGHPTWSVAIPPEAALAARDKYNKDKDAKRLYPTQNSESEESNDTGKTGSSEYMSVGTEAGAINTLTNRKPGADPVRDDTWTARDDVSTLGRPSMDQRPDLDEVRGLLHKESNKGKRRQVGSPLQESSQPRQTMPPLPFAINPSPVTTSAPFNYAPPPPPQIRTQQAGQQQHPLASPSSVSTGHIEEFQYQQMVPPPRSTSRPGTERSPIEGGNAFANSMREPVQPPRVTNPGAGTATGTGTGTGTSTNPYRAGDPSGSPPQQYPYRP